MLSRQALISLKLLAAGPSVAKHTADLRQLRPSADELRAALRFVLSHDASAPRRDDLRLVLAALDQEALVGGIDERL